MRNRLIILCALLSFSSVLRAQELDIGKVYRLGITLPVTELGDNSDPKRIYIARKSNKFSVISKKDNGEYVVNFNSVYTLDGSTYASTKWVEWDKAYVLPSKFHGVNISDVSNESLTGLSAGPLIVPFKYRTNDDSLSGDATIGMYAGITWEPGCSQSNWCFRITPLISAGISQVTVGDGDNTESKTSATWAAGFLISSWADLNIGVIYGQDRIGDNTWEHEGKGWVSVMVGWEL